MNNYYTLSQLSAFLDRILDEALFVSAISQKKRTIELVFEKNDQSSTLFFQASHLPVLFLQSFRASRKTNTAHFFESLEGMAVSGVSLDQRDRILVIHFENAELRFVMFGAKANVFLFENGEEVESFRSVDLPVIHAVRDDDIRSVESAQNAKEKILLTDPKFPRHLIHRLVRRFDLGSMPDADLVMLVRSWGEEMLARPSYRRLSTGEICLLSESVLPDDGAKIFENVNELVRQAWLDKEVRFNYEERRRKILEDLDSNMARLEKMLEDLAQAPNAATRADHYEITGHILMAYSYLGDFQEEVVSLDNPFEPGTKVQISGKKGASFSENAQLYYIKAKNTRKSIEASKDRMVEIHRKCESLGELIRSFEAVDGPRSLERWLKSHGESFRMFGSDVQRNQVATPWRVVSCMGYEVWIGKSAASNDLLTQAAHKEDIWMHARHVSGSHVVIRMGRRSDFPPKEVLEQVASWAAFYSKAKSAGLASVAFTKRKYVRKRKGSAPGSVIVDKEQVLLVTPTKPTIDDPES